MSGIKSFLSEIGKALANGAMSYIGLPPVFLPKPAPAGVINAVSELAQISVAAIQIEAIGKSANLTGAQKMDALKPQVIGILKASLALGHNPVQDEVLFQKGSDEIAQGVVDCLNAMKPI